MLGREFAHHVQLLEAPAELRARADRVLDQQHEFPQLQPACRLAHAFEKMHDPLLHRVALVVAGMRDQILGADRHGAFQFAAKRLDRELADLFVRRGEVDQVVVVNRQRVEIVFLAGAIQQRGSRGRWAPRPSTAVDWTRKSGTCSLPARRL